MFNQKPIFSFTAHPLDQTKYRMQVMHQPKNIIHTLFQFASRDGILSLWTGLTGSWLRQCSYSTARFGLYNYFAKEVKQRTATSKLTAGWEILCSGVAGGAAGLIGNPTEVVLVRMCADGAKLPAERYNYGNSIRALFKIAKDEGMATFSRGLTPNIIRSIIMSKLVSFLSSQPLLTNNPSRHFTDRHVR
jgi:dicarboxylate transporter 10